MSQAQTVQPVAHTPSDLVSELSLTGCRGGFARCLFLWHRDPLDVEKLSDCFAVADGHNRAALNDATRGLAVRAWEAVCGDEAPGRMTVATVRDCLDNMARCPEQGPGCNSTGWSELEACVRSLFLAVDLGAVRCPRADLIPTRRPRGADRLSRVRDAGATPSFGMMSPGSSTWEHAWRDLTRVFGDTVCEHAGEGWQYMGTVLPRPGLTVDRMPARVVHQFRHRCLPGARWATGWEVADGFYVPAHYGITVPGAEAGPPAVVVEVVDLGAPAGPPADPGGAAAWSQAACGPF